MEQFQAAMQEVDARKRAESAKAGETFLAENAKKKGVTTTASGLQYEVLKAGEGPAHSHRHRQSSLQGHPHQR